MAKDLGLSREQLDDRLVPHCEFDAQGTRVFDFGPRQFHLALGPELQAVLRDSDGKLLANLPNRTKRTTPAKRPRPSRRGNN